MTKLFEEGIANYLALSGSVFLAPQYNIIKQGTAGKQGTSCPDFVALDFDRKRIVVVEVTTAWDLNGLVTRISNRNVEWYEPIRAKLPDTDSKSCCLRVEHESASLGRSPDTDTKSWCLRVLAFVRTDRIKWIRNKFLTETDVTFYPLEKAIFGWRYDETRVANGLPDRTIDSSMAEHEW